MRVRRKNETNREIQPTFYHISPLEESLGTPLTGNVERVRLKMERIPLNIMVESHVSNQ